MFQSLAGVGHGLSPAIRGNEEPTNAGVPSGRATLFLGHSGIIRFSGATPLGTSAGIDEAIHYVDSIIEPGPLTQKYPDLFKDAGLEPPNSWEAWGEAAQALTVRDGDNVTRWGLEYPSGWPYWLFQPLAIGNGQNIIGDSDAEVYFDNPKVIEAVQFYIDLSKKYQAMPEGVQSVWGQAPTDFASEQTAMIVHSSGSLRGILKQANFNVGVMPIPGSKPDTYATVPGGGNLYIFANVDKAKQDAAWKFARFLSEPERTADFSIQSGYFASRKSAYETDAMKAYLADHPQVEQARDALQYAGAEFSVQDLGEVRNIFHDYLQKAYNGEMSPAEAMATAQKEADAALAPFKTK